MRILLTGATGFLGNNLLRILLRDNHEVSVTLRQSSDLRPLDGLNVEKLYTDLNDPNQVGLALNNIDLVIHAAALIQLGWTRLEESMSINADATRIIAESCRRRNVRMIFISSVDALSVGSEDQPADETCIDPAKSNCSYVISKRKGEQYFCDEIEQGLNGILINPGFMIGPWDWKPSSGKMMIALSKNFILFAPGGGFTVVDVRDVAEGVLSAINNGRAGSRYILGGVNMSYLELWQLMAKVMGCRGASLRTPDWLATGVGWLGDFFSRFTKNELDINSGCVGLGQMDNYYSSEKAQSELGYQIGSVETAIQDAWDWFKAYKYV